MRKALRQPLHADVQIVGGWDDDGERSDVEAGRAAGCTTVFIDLGYAEPAPDDPDFVVHSIAEAADVIIKTTSTAQRAS